MATGVREGILIVDDEEIIRRSLHKKLSREGYCCEEAGSAEEALRKLRRDSPQLVILDIKMPGKSGYELLPEIRASYPETAVIMATAVAETSRSSQRWKSPSLPELLAHCWTTACQYSRRCKSPSRWSPIGS